jgi:hypothetical protein
LEWKSGQLIMGFAKDGYGLKYNECAGRSCWLQHGEGAEATPASRAAQGILNSSMNMVESALMVLLLGVWSRSLSRQIRIQYGHRSIVFK